MRFASWASNLAILVWCLWTASTVWAQGCSVENPCAIGCCSSHGYCGVGDEYCGAGNCVANCDFKLECDANHPCADDACCSKNGYCGLGPDFCAPENCVAGCDAKSQCDPGDFGSYAKGTKCPLNVCCSKFGFCGTTKDFCGSKTVKRPSCDARVGTGAFRRIVGYYEGWATTRVCNDFWPEQIPAGYYTHLNYAFAAIDPKTFEVRPASSEEIPVIKRLAALKNYDPDLKVFIAIGGWTFNDPGPTRSTFSDLAASAEAQKKFFKSLISFLATYNLDGVDLDWEYPGPDDIVERGGRAADFQNFPKLLGNLKEALKSSGGRDGLSVTLPASYWYLQYFDIVELEKHVDFFNIMSYDLHGAWDKGNKWTGSFLNAHTNLTEIKDALDLLWRNDIDPSKVVMGLGFYGRAFTATTIACMEPGCTFESAGNKGLCSRENGILLNSEILDMIKQHSLTPRLFEKEAVKLITWGDQWVAYDDADTLETKINFAYGQCLGGVMVWAISHDTSDAKFTRALGQITGRQGKSLVTIGENDYKQVRKYIDQCKWTNCGETCPSGYAPIIRDDKWKRRESELMLDSTGCLDGLVHTLCCPKDEMPSCGWYSHKNGKCNYECPSGYVEIGSYSGGCGRNYQAACCTVDRKSMDIWDTCTWSGTPSKCDDICPPIQKWPLVTSPSGSGGMECKDNKERKYCCDLTYEQRKWGDCKWEKFSGIFVQFEDNPDYCASSCPGGQYRVSMEKTGVCSGKPGAAAYCCESEYYNIVTEEKDEVKRLKEGLQSFVKNPICLPEWHTSDVFSSTKKRGLATVVEARTFVDTLERILAAPPGNNFQIQKDIVHLNAALNETYPHMVFPDFGDFLETNYSDFHRLDKRECAEDIACDLDRWDDLASETPVLSCPVDYCDELESGCSEAAVDPGEPCEGTNVNALDERAVTGNIRWYCMDVPDSDGGGADRNNVHSPRYPAADDWEPDDEVRTRGVILWNHRDCANPDVRRVAVPQDGLFINGRRMAMHSEHPPEYNTFATFFNDAVRGQLSNRAADQNAFRPIPAGFLRRIWFDRATVPTSIWGFPPGGRDTSIPYQRLFETFGSQHNRKCFFIVQASLNYAKTDVWRWRERQLLTEEMMRPLIVVGVLPWRALHEIRKVFAVFRYLDGEEVRECMIELLNDFRAELRVINRAWNAGRPNERFESRAIWDRWMRHQFTEMVQNAQERVSYWLGELERAWANENTPLAARVRSDINRLRNQIANRIRLRLDGLEEAMPVDDANDPIVQ